MNRCVRRVRGACVGKGTCFGVAARHSSLTQTKKVP